MATFNFSSFASTIANQALTNTTGTDTLYVPNTTTYLPTANGFPAVQFEILLDQELMFVTAINLSPGSGPANSHAWTVLRAQGGTSASAHNLNTQVLHEFGAGAASNMVQLSPSSAQTGNINLTGTHTGTQFISTIATGTAPLQVTSTTQVANLNASQVGGYSAGTASGNALVNPMTTTQDLLVGGASGVATRLAAGTGYNSLQMDGAGNVIWGTSPKDTLTATGDILYSSAANTLARLPIGSDGYVLQTQASVPNWFNLFGAINSWTNQQIFTYSSGFLPSVLISAPTISSGNLFGITANGSSIFSVSYLGDVSSSGSLVSTPATSTPSPPPFSPVIATGAITGGALAAGTYYYAYTYIDGTAASKESVLGGFSTGATVASGTTGSVAITLPVGPTMSPAITGRNLYRSTSANGPFLKVLGQGDNTTTSLTDPGWSVGGYAPLGQDAFNVEQSTTPLLLAVNPSTAIGSSVSGATVAQMGAFSIGLGPWDGSTSGHFSGSTGGTSIALNSPSTFTGNFIDAQLLGARKFAVDYQGNIFGNAVNQADYFVNNVVSGGLVPAGSNGTVTVPSGVAYINGTRYSFPSSTVTLANSTNYTIDWDSTTLSAVATSVATATGAAIATSNRIRLAFTTGGASTYTVRDLRQAGMVNVPVSSISSMAPNNITPTVSTSVNATLSPPAAAPTFANSTTGGSIPAGFHAYAYTWVGANGETIPGPTGVTAATTGATSSVTVTLATLPAGSLGARIYRSQVTSTSAAVALTMPLYQCGVLVSGTTFVDTLADASLGSQPPSFVDTYDATYMSGHFIASGRGTPTITNTSTSANTSMAMFAGSNDTAGGVGFSTTATPVTGTQVKVTFAVPLSAAPKAVMLTWANTTATTIPQLKSMNLGATSFEIGFMSSPNSAASTMSMYYWVIG